MFDRKAADLVRELQESGVTIDNIHRFTFETAHALEAEWTDLSGRAKLLERPDIESILSTKRSTHRYRPVTGMQTVRPDQFPLFNNVTGRGHGFNGLCSLPSKADCLLAIIPNPEPTPDPYAEPLTVTSLPLPAWEPADDRHSKLKQLLPTIINFS
jgi:hypothetical protein